MINQLLNKSQQLEQLLRRNFSSNEWMPGAKLPSEDSLMKAFGVSRPSMREALNTLVAEGIVTRRHGSGTYLVRKPVNRVEVFIRLENVAAVSGYWYRDMLHMFQALGREQNIQIEPILGIGENFEDVMASLARNLSRPSGPDLSGTISLMTSSDIDSELLKTIQGPFTVLSLFPRKFPGEVILNYKSMAQKFRETMLAYGYEDYALIYINDLPDKIGQENYRQLQLIYDIVTGGDKSKQIGLTIDHFNETDFQEKLEKGFMEWFRSSRRTRAAVFFDDGVFSNCCRVMYRHGIRIPEDLAVLTHANVGRFFDFPFIPYRVGFDAKQTARVMWNSVFSENKSTELIEPVIMPGDSLPVIDKKISRK